EELPHRYYEEDNLHGFLLEQEKDYESCLEAMERFLPYMDNWATCDLVSPKVFGEHKEELTKAIDRWLSSEETYTVRYGINMLIRYFLKEDFRPEYLERVAKIRSEEYYVRMAVAWYFATALTEQYEAALPFIEKKCLEPWTHNKAIQKARESLQIEKSRKEYLSRLKK
ncbi:MAG: DNA alkylation repair protein, partial [Lachnospiraceae bacterium]|nr:DNA alkylation repair protein [Lachnospiraceae bacterium]